MTNRAVRTVSSYARHTPTTDPGVHADRVAALPAEVAELVDVGHGLVVHEHFAPAYGVTLSDDDRSTAHHPSIERFLDHVVARDDRRLVEPREPFLRVAGNCWHFALLLVTALRGRGIPARARCGFAAYFNEGRFEDHWVCEHWHEAKQRWVLVDAQVDAMQRGMFEIDLDTRDVPRDQFLVAGQAWALCRSGEADPADFGLSITGRSGLDYVASNLMRDAASLRGREMLPDARWGSMPRFGEPVDDDFAALLDRLAAATADPDARAAELERLYDDERLRATRAPHAGEV